MKKMIFSLALALGIALGGVVLTTSNVLACGGKDKDSTTQEPAGSGDNGTQS